MARFDGSRPVGTSVVGVRPSLRPAIGLPPAPETGWTARARTGPGYDPRGPPLRPGVVARSEIDPQLAVVQMRPGGIPPAGTVEDGNGYWARLSSSDTSDIHANDLKTTSTMYLTVRSSDKYIEISGVTLTKVS
jgi:hypothetical protein